MVQTLQQNQMNAYGYLPQNLLVNPGFEIWQRGAGPFTTDDAFTADEWDMQIFGGDTLSVSRESTEVKSGSYSMKLVKGGSDADGHVRQGIENYKQLEGLTITLSMWVKSSIVDNVSLAILDYTTGVDYTSSARNQTTDWERLTVSKTIRTGLASYIQFPHSFGIEIVPQIFNPSTVYLDGASLVIGNFPEGVPFIPLNPAEDLARCERFYNAGGSNAGSRFSGDVTSSVGYYASMRFSTTMFASPTVSLLNMLNVRFSSTPGSIQTNDYGFNENRIAVSTGSGGLFASSWTAEVT